MTIYSKIIAGEIPCYKITEDENFFAFLDIFPLVKGHVLVVPKTEVDDLFDLPEKYLSKLFIICAAHCKKPLKKVSIATVAALKSLASEVLACACTFIAGQFCG